MGSIGRKENEESASILVSSCLIGMDCRYDGENNEDAKVLRYLEDKGFIHACPEQLGGLSTPRNPSVVPDGGEKVIDDDGKVVMKGGCLFQV